MNPRVKYDHPNGYNPDGSYPWASDLQVLSWVPSQSHILELGCATGYMGRYLRDKKNCRVTGVDSDAHALSKAEGFYNQVVHSDLNNDPNLGDIRGQFDVILCVAILEHLKEPERLLKSLKNRLNTKGRIIVSLPNIAHWSIRWQILRGHFNYTNYGILDSTHLRFFTYFSAQQLIQQAGYRLNRLSIDPDAGIPYINGILRHLPAGWTLLRFLYNRRPNLFAYQILMEATLS